jgi:hypothetical protein
MIALKEHRTPSRRTLWSLLLCLNADSLTLIYRLRGSVESIDSVDILRV